MSNFPVSRVGPEGYLSIFANLDSRLSHIWTVLAPKSDLMRQLGLDSDAIVVPPYYHENNKLN